MSEMKPCPDDTLERWPGYDEQSWRERFFELERRHGEHLVQLLNAARSARTPSPVLDGELRPSELLFAVNNVERVERETRAQGNYVTAGQLRDAGNIMRAVLTALGGVKQNSAAGADSRSA